MLDKYDVFLNYMYKDVAIEINKMAEKDGLSVLPMSFDDENIDIDDKRLLVYIDDYSRILEFDIG
jgi:hypothetical protein